MISFTLEQCVPFFTPYLVTVCLMALDLVPQVPCHTWRHSLLCFSFYTGGVFPFVIRGFICESGDRALFRRPLQRSVVFARFSSTGLVRLATADLVNLEHY